MFSYSVIPLNIFVGLDVWVQLINRVLKSIIMTLFSVNLPSLSPTMEKGTVKEWHKQEGDELNEGDVLAQIETDKSTMDFETPEPGFLAKILLKSGDRDTPVGQVSITQFT